MKRAGKCCRLNFREGNEFCGEDGISKNDNHAKKEL